MTGRKSLDKIRDELEAALGAGPAGDGEVAESLRRFLAAGLKRQGTPKQPLYPTGGASPASDGAEPTGAPPAGER
ncbi:MAG TPA: hypothetical protein VHR66_01190 [Gemmataceae bacterium]|jgi:hypothetical protein|nr:hypothetical protein [Gemmataceae bacterium]